MSLVTQPPASRPAMPRTGHGHAVLLVAVLAAAALGLAAVQAAGAVAPGRWWPAAVGDLPQDPAALVFGLSTLPRIAVAMLAGAALAVAGGLTQAVLGNPLAVPGTLGVTAGAQLAVLVATLCVPTLAGLPRETVALAGGFGSFAVVLAAAAAGRFSPLALVLAGFSVGLFCAAVGGVVELVRHENVGAVVLWGAGSLVQDDWSVAASLAPRLAGLAALVVLVARPVAVASALSDEGARGLGLPLPAVRAAALGLAVALSASVTAAVGIVAFVDLAAPSIVRLAGARRLGPQLALAGAAGAALLLLVDTGVQALGGRAGAFVPTGAATAVLAAPLVLALLPRMRRNTLGTADAAGAGEARAVRPSLVLVCLVLACAGVVLLALGIGRTGQGWSWPMDMDAAVVTQWRLPRTLLAMASGAALGLAGAVMQRSTGNPLASPESLGIGAATMAGFAALLMVNPAPSLVALAAAGTAGALAALGMLTLTGLRARFAPDQMLLAGMALGGAANALIIVFLSLNDGRAAILAGWLAGSTAAFDGTAAVTALFAVAVLGSATLLLARPLDLLRLGESVAQAVGVALGPVRLGLLLVTAVMTAGAVLAVGPLTFVGLLGPQLASRLGLARSRTHLPGAALCGAIVMVSADWVGRVAAAPFEVPAGLMASLVGIPALVVLLARRRRPG